MENVFKLDKLIDKYMDTFEMNFPRTMVKHLDTDEIIKIVENCLETNTPYEPEITDGEIV